MRVWIIYNSNPDTMELFILTASYRGYLLLIVWLTEPR